jgi:hypothetical protein
MFRANVSTEHGVAVLHPSGRAPGRGEEKEVGIGGERGAQRGQNVIAVAVDAEMLEVGIGGAIVVAVCGSAVITGADRDASHA